jgi:hypothetical protein
MTAVYASSVSTVYVLGKYSAKCWPYRGALSLSTNNSTSSFASHLLRKVLHFEGPRHALHCAGSHAAHMATISMALRSVDFGYWRRFRAMQPNMPLSTLVQLWRYTGPASMMLISHRSSLFSIVT